VRALARRYGVGRGAPSGRARRFGPPAARAAAPVQPAPQQLTLL